jgi:hypothetical protein
VQLGEHSGGLTDVDLDSAEAILAAPYFLQSTQCFGRASKPRSHWLYTSELWRTEDNAAIQFKFTSGRGKERVEKMVLELRIGGGGRGAQTVFPGSVHESGEEITWAEELPVAKADGADLKRRCARAAAAALMAANFPAKGARHDAGLTIGGFLFRCGFSRPDVGVFAEAVTVASGQGREKVRDVRKAASEAWDVGKKGGEARGFPILAETFGEDVAKCVAKWLDYQGGDADRRAPESEPFYQDSPHDYAPSEAQWEEPKPIPDGLPPVSYFETDFLPGAIGAWVLDIADRMQCPVDFVAIPAIAALGSVLGCKIGMRPKQRSDWTVIPNIWGMVIGTPGAMKSPAIGEALKPLRRIEAKACDTYKTAKEHYERETEIFKMMDDDAKSKARKRGGLSLPRHMRMPDRLISPPSRRRDATLRATLPMKSSGSCSRTTPLA